MRDVVFKVSGGRRWRGAAPAPTSLRNTLGIGRAEQVQVVQIQAMLSSVDGKPRRALT